MIDELKKHFIRNIEKFIREQHTAEILFESLNHIKGKTNINSDSSKEPAEVFNAIAELAGGAEENNIVDAYPSSLILKRILKAPFGNKRTWNSLIP